MQPRVEATEAEWAALVEDCLTLGQWKWWHCREPRGSRAGLPDYIAVHPQRGILFAELKSARGRLRPEQEAWLRELSLAIGSTFDAQIGSGRRRIVVRIWRPADYAEVLEVTGVAAMCDPAS